MLGLGLALSIAKKTLGDAIDGLLSTLSGRATYYENGSASKSTIKAIDDADILDKATILLTPTATSDARVHSVKTYTGDEYITNGDFSDGINDWNSNASATLSTENDKLKVSVSGAGSGYGQQNIIGLTIGATYKISAEGEIGTSTRLALYTPNAGFNNLYSDGVISTFFTATSTTENLRLYVYDDGAYGFWDNISVVDVSSDFDFDRASSATRINSDGLVQDMQSITDPELVLNGDFEELGSELVTNGDFSNWTGDNPDNYLVLNEDANNYVTESNGQLRMVSDNSATIAIRPQPTTMLTVGKTYKVSVDLTFTTGTLNISGIDFNTSGTKVFYLTAGSTYLQLAKGSALDVLIDNVSVKEVDPNDYWTLGSGWSIEDGELVHTGAGTYAEQGSLTPGNEYEVVIVVAEASGSGFPQIYMGGLTTAMTSPDTYTFYITAQSGDKIKLRALNDCKVASVSVKDITFSTDVDLARINYDSNGDNGHILLEPTSTNIIINNNNSFTASRTSITYNNINSPEGIQNAFKVEATTTGGAVYVRTSDITCADTTFSVFVKHGNNQWLQFLSNQSANHYFNFDVQNGVFGTNGTSTSNLKATDFGNGWYRVSGTFTGNTGSCQLRVYLSNASSSGYGGASATSGDFFYSYGWQAEELSYATSYIPTLTGSTVTRATETLTGSGNSTLINSTEGVLYAEIAAFEVQPDFFISINDGTNNNRVIIKFSDAVDNQLTAFTINSTNSSSITHTVSDFKQYNKIALSYNSSYLKLFVNGQEVGTSVASPNLAVGLNVLNLSNLPTDKNVKGKCKALAVFNEALSDTELQNLTS